MIDRRERTENIFSKYLSICEWMYMRFCAVPFIFCVRPRVQSSVHGHAHVRLRETHLQPLMEQPEGRRWVVWQEREKKRREGGWERVIRVVRSVTGKRSLPRERPLQGGRRGRHVGGACHRAYWQSVSKATRRRGNNRSRDRRVPARKEKSTLVRIPGNEREIAYVGGGEGVNSRQDQSRTGQKRVGQNI